MVSKFVTWVDELAFLSLCLLPLLKFLCNFNCDLESSFKRKSIANFWEDDEDILSGWIETNDVGERNVVENR